MLIGDERHGHCIRNCEMYFEDYFNLFRSHRSPLLICFNVNTVGSYHNNAGF